MKSVWNLAGGLLGRLAPCHDSRARQRAWACWRPRCARCALLTPPPACCLVQGLHSSGKEMLNQPGLLLRALPRPHMQAVHPQLGGMHRQLGLLQQELRARQVRPALPSRRQQLHRQLKMLQQELRAWQVLQERRRKVLQGFCLLQWQLQPNQRQVWLRASRPGVRC